MAAVVAECVAGAAIVLFAIYALGISLLPAVVMTAFLIVLIYVFLSASLKNVSQLLESQKLFVSNVAHELRGPMSVMQLDAEAALHNVTLAQLTDIKTKELVGAINSDLDGLRQMTNIIKNLSLLASQQYSSEQLAFTKVELSTLLARLCSAAEREFAYDKSILIKLESKSPVNIMGNESALEQMIMNIFKNAVNYSPAGTSIVASAQQHKTGVKLSIRDHGFGISEEDLPHILDPFYRGRHTRATENTAGGSGLGLAIVAALAKQHKAIVTISSALKKGTTVTLNFPLIPVGA